MNSKSFIILTIALVSVPALAAGGDIPMGTVVSQIANLSILIGAIVFFTRKQVAEFFAEKKASFLEHVNAASNSKKNAEEKLQEVSARLDTMKESFSQQVVEAKKNAEESFRIQVADARNEAEKIKNSAQSNLQYEIQNQIENLRVEAFKKSADMAEKNMENKLTPEQLKTWNSKFSQSSKGAQ